MTKSRAIEFLMYQPYYFGWSIGFKKLTKLHNDWIASMIQPNQDRTLKAHRNSYKTTCVSLALAIIIVLYPKDKTLFVRKTDNDVKEIIKQVKKILLSPQMQAFVTTIYNQPLILTVDNATEIDTNLNTDVKGGSQLVGAGIGGSLTGKHFDRIFTDDIVNVSDRISKAEREHTKLMYQELKNLINRGGFIFNTGTTWHKEDCFTIMPPAEIYTCYDTGLMTEEQIAEKKASMTPALFSANYELKIIADEDVIFETPPSERYSTNFIRDSIWHIDSAYGGEDYTAFSALKKVSDTEYYLYGRLWRKHIDDCKADIEQDIDRLMLGKGYTEDNGDKGYVAKEFKKDGYRIVKYHENMNKYVKISTYLKNIWRYVKIVEGTDEEYINQICDYNENAEHDDAPDSASCLARKLLNKNTEEKNEYINPMFM